nr:hypothetical protein [Halomarina oriensis]
METTTCRQVVAFLLEVDGVWDVRTLADELVRLDPTLPPDTEADRNPVEERAIRLYHCALPKLAEAGVVEFDVDEQTVAPAERLDALGAHLGETIDYSDGGGRFGGVFASS